MSIFLQLLLLTCINVCIAQIGTMNNQIVRPIIAIPTKDFSILFMTSFGNLSNNTNADIDDFDCNHSTFGVPQRTIQNSTVNVSEIDYDAALSLSCDVNGFANITDSRKKDDAYDLYSANDIYVHCVIIIIMFVLFVVYRSNDVVFKTSLILLIGLCLKTFAAQASTINIVAGRGDHSCALSTSNAVKCWGKNTRGQLGYGDTNNRGKGDRVTEMGNNLLEIDLGSGFTATQITAGYLHTCALSTSNALKCWGENLSGQLGYGDEHIRGAANNTMGDNLPAIDLGLDFSVTQIVAGYCSTCALSRSNAVKCWGCNPYGNLGTGDWTWRGRKANQMGNNLSEIDLGSGFKATQIAVGEYHTCALSTNNTIKCWGRNFYGRLGYGDTNDRDGANEMGDNLLEIDLGDGFKATQIAAGRDHTCAVSRDNSVKCWGGNSDGQLGAGDTNNRGDGVNEMGAYLLPIDLGFGFAATQIVTGDCSTCALSTNDAVKCWGWNSHGQLGAGDTENRGDEANEMGAYLLEIDLGSGFDATQIVTGDSHSCALSRTHSVKCWGSNYYGQLGVGDVYMWSRGSAANEMGDFLLDVLLGSAFTPTMVPTSDPTSDPTSEPTTSPPTYSPTSSAPSAAPTTYPPTTAEPTAYSPTTSVPTTYSPTTEPTTYSPTSSAPTTHSPTASEPTTTSPTSSNPTTSSPTSSVPTTYSPTASEPTTSSPTSSEPTTYSPTISEPTTSSPTTSEPTTNSPTTAVPTTYSPTTAEPTYNPTSESPTNNPSQSPTYNHTNNSTNNATDRPTKAPSYDIVNSSNNPTISVFLFIFIQLFHSYFF